MNFTDCVTCTSHILLPIGSLLRSRNELFNPEEAGITRMFCCHCDNGGVYHCQRLGGEKSESRRRCGDWGGRKYCIQRETEIAWECASNKKKYTAAARWALSGNISYCVPCSDANLPSPPLWFSHTSSGFLCCILCFYSCMMFSSPLDCVRRLKRWREMTDP